MFITELDGHGNYMRADDHGMGGSSYIYGEPRRSITHSLSSSMSDEASSYATAANSLQRLSSSEGGGMGFHGSNPGTRSRPDSRQRMGGSSSTITAAAAAQEREQEQREEQRARELQSSGGRAAMAAATPTTNWPGAILRQTDIRIESQDLASLDAELRRRSTLLPREGRWSVAGDREALSELAHFLRNVSPPPSNYMSRPDPTSPGTLSSTSSFELRRRASGRKTKKKGGGPLRLALGFFRRAAGGSALRSKKGPHKKRAASPQGLSRTSSVASRGSVGSKKKRRRVPPPRIKLPDSAVAGTTVEGYRHIAISIPIEHAHLGPEPRYRFPSVDGRRTRWSESTPTTPSSSSGASPHIYNDLNVRPMTAYAGPATTAVVAAAERHHQHVGTQLGPLFEERESLSSRSLERMSGIGIGIGIGGGGGGSVSGGGTGSSSAGGEETAASRSSRARLASRHTFGTVHEGQQLFGAAGRSGGSGGSSNGSRPNTAHGGLASPVLRVSSDESSAGGGGGGAGGGAQPRTPRTSDEVRSLAHKQALAALAGGSGGGEGSGSGPANAQGRPNSEYSFRSFATPSPLGRATAVRRSGPYQTSPSSGEGVGRARARSNSDRLLLLSTPQRGRQLHSRDSSRDQQTLQESIFSEQSYLGSVDTMETGVADQHPEGQQVPTPGSVGVVQEATAARRFEGREVVVHAGDSRGSDSSSGIARGRGAKSESIDRSTVVVVPASYEERGAVWANEMSPSQPPRRRFPLVNTAAEDARPEVVAAAELEDAPEVEDAAFSREANMGSDSKGKGKEISPQALGENSRPTTPFQYYRDGKRLSDDQTPADARKDEAEEHGQPAASHLSTPERRPRSQGKGMRTESSPPRVVVTKERSRSRSRAETKDGKAASPIPSPKERKERRKTILISRRQRFAELKKALDQPGMQPKDLVWERSLSVSSSGSDDSTPKARKIEEEEAAKRHSLPYPSDILTVTPTRPKTVPPSLSLTRVVTVADLQPSSPEHVNLVRKDSVPLSISSPTTVSTVIKASPIPPFRSLGSVTPPESPPLYDDFPSPPLSPVATLATPLRHRPHPLPLKRLASSRSLSSSGSRRRASPVLTAREASPPRPKTAGKGALASNKDFFFGGTGGSNSGHPQGGSGRYGRGHGHGHERAAMVSPELSSKASRESLASLHRKSVLKMSRSEIFERYEALREKQARDMEKRMRRLENNGEYWLKSMLPLLSDLSLTLGRLAEGGQHGGNDTYNNDNIVVQEVSAATGKGKEKEVMEEEVQPRATTSYAYEDGRQSRFGTRVSERETVRPKTFHGFISRERSEDTLGGLDPDLQRRRRNNNHNENNNESISRLREDPLSPYGHETHAQARGRRIYLQDSPMLHPDLGYRVDTRSRTDDGLSSPLRHPHTPAHAFEDGGPFFPSDVGGSGAAVRRPRYRRTRTTFHAPEAPDRQQQEQQPQQQQQQRRDQHLQQPPTSRSTTMVGSTTAGARSSSLLASVDPFKPSPKRNLSSPLSHSSHRLQQQQHQQAKNVVDQEMARIQRLSLEDSPGLPASPPRSFGGPRSRGVLAARQKMRRKFSMDDSGDEGGGGIGSSGSSLKTYDDTDRDDVPAVRTRDRGQIPGQGVLGGGSSGGRYGGGYGGNEGRLAFYGGSRSGGRNGMETIEPLMRELQVAGSRPSLESLGSNDIGDDDVRRMRRGPGPRAVVGFGAFSM